MAISLKRGPNTCQYYWIRKWLSLLPLCCIRMSSLTVVPYPIPFNMSGASPKTFSQIFEVSLFWIPEQQQFKFCYTSPSDNLCNQTSSPSQDLIAPEGFCFWWNGTLTKALSKNINKELLCLPMTLVPQLTLLTLAEYLSWNMLPPPHIKIKPAVFLPVVAW